MDDNAKNTASYQLDQEILDARGINMTVEEVAGLPTCKYADRVHSLKLNEEDLAFLKGLRRRIKNRLASQNSRRRSVEHLRRLTRELRAVRACRRDALAERRSLVKQRDSVRGQCVALRRYLVQTLQARSDNTDIPRIDSVAASESQTLKEVKKVTVKETIAPLLAECFTEKLDKDKNIFHCCIDKLVQQSVNHMFKTDEEERKKIFAKTIFISNDKMSSNVKNVVLKEDSAFKGLLDEGGVLNLSVKEGRRRSHGRKQTAPRRIVYTFEDNDGILAKCVGEESYKAHDRMGWTDKQKLVKLALLLLSEAKLKLRQVTEVRDEHSVMISFDIGVIIGQIREKYKRMLETYRDVLDRITNRTLLKGPSLPIYRPVHYIIAMELVHQKEVEIDQLIKILEAIPPKMLNKSSTQQTNQQAAPNTTSVATPPSPPRLRADDNGRTETDIEDSEEKENALKKKYREEYLLRQMGPGMNASSVARGRYSILDMNN